MVVGSSSPDDLIVPFAVRHSALCNIDDPIYYLSIGVDTSESLMNERGEMALLRLTLQDFMSPLISLLSPLLICP